MVQSPQTNRNHFSQIEFIKTAMLKTIYLLSTHGQPIAAIRNEAYALEMKEKFKDANPTLMELIILECPEKKKVVINTCYGGFSLSEEARALIGIDRWQDCDIARDDPKLVEVVERLGDEANTAYSELKVIEIPADLDYRIDNYDGKETVVETSRCYH